VPYPNFGSLDIEEDGTKIKIDIRSDIQDLKMCYFDL